MSSLYKYTVISQKWLIYFYFESEKQSSMKRVDLPLHSVPAYNLTLMSHKAIKGMVCKKNRPSNATKLKEIKDIVSVPQPGQASRITPQEIELLRKVPLGLCCCYRLFLFIWLY